jgi:hypothetical protein
MEVFTVFYTGAATISSKYLVFSPKWHISEESTATTVITTFSTESHISLA